MRKEKLKINTNIFWNFDFIGKDFIFYE